VSFPEPLNPLIENDIDVYGAVYEFVKEYALPSIPPENIFRGWQNRAYLPPQSNEFAVISIISHERRGSNVETFSAETEGEDGRLTSSELIICRVQVDCYSASDASARTRAQMLEKAARGSIAPRFFARFGMGCCYASNARDMSVVNGSKQFVNRWMTEISLSYPSAFSVGLPWFDAAKFDRVENVDVHHPPKE
jgi:hypothetical protein